MEDQEEVWVSFHQGEDDPLDMKITSIQEADKLRGLYRGPWHIYKGQGSALSHYVKNILEAIDADNNYEKVKRLSAGKTHFSIEDRMNVAWIVGKLQGVAIMMKHSQNKEIAAYMETIADDLALIAKGGGK